MKECGVCWLCKLAWGEGEGEGEGFAGRGSLVKYPDLEMFLPSF